MNAIVSRETWETVSVPTDAVVVGCRWVYTLKYCSDGSVDRYTARFVAKGYTQTYGINYFETFSLDARMNFIRIIFSVAVNLSWPLYQLDVKNAFLYGNLRKEVYMEQLPGYVAQGENKVCCLKKAIYCLKQSQGRGLRSSALPSLVMIFTDVTQITLSSFDAQSLALSSFDAQSLAL